MKKNLRLWLVAAVGAVASIAFTSCAYDPYYSSVGGSYSSGYGGGYGDGYGYGNSSFNTSVFISTGSPRWGYDPYSYCYYDYNRRAYYDPYLYGYYPVGYRPPVVYGVPHPHGWRPGRGYISPPSRVYYGTVSNYKNRESAYRSTNYDWAKQVRQRPVEQGRVQGTRPSKTSQYQRPETGSRTSSGRVSPSRTSDGRTSTREEVRPSTRQQTQSRYNSPVTTARPQASSAQRPQLGVPRESRSQATRESSQPRVQSQARGQSQSRPQPQSRSQPQARAQSEARSQGGNNRESRAAEDKRIRGYR
ncbi:MAG: hypothetical protein WEB53_00605 [Akkermansiaceae bacterium]